MVGSGGLEEGWGPGEGAGEGGYPKRLDESNGAVSFGLALLEQ